MANTITSDELTSLRERQGMLQWMRVAMASAIMLGPILSPTVVTNTIDQLAIPTAAFFAIIVLSEISSRLSRQKASFLARSMTLVDVIYVSIVLTQTGGSQSPLAFVAYVHLIAVTLLLSYRTGLKVALAYSIGIFTAHTIRLGGIIPSLLGPATTVTANVQKEVFNAVAFWIVAIGTALFSSLSERELRRRKGEFGLISEFVQALEQSTTPDGVTRDLLARSTTTFGFRRGVVIIRLSGGQYGIVSPEGYTVRKGTIEDSAILKAWKTHSPELFKKVDALNNPLLSEVLPSANNIAILPLTAETEPLGALVIEWGKRRGSRVPGHTIRLLAQMTAQTALVLRNVILMAEINRLATTDGLTGLANRRVFDETLYREIARAERTGQPLTLVMFDIDHFKSVNDTYGHQIGDQVLQAASSALLSTCREADMAARYGGEEMSVIMVGCSADEAIEATERFRSAIATSESPVNVTVSAGTATFPLHALDANTLLAAADEALYKSKHTGRDRSTQSDRETLASISELRLG